MTNTRPEFCSSKHDFASEPIRMDQMAESIEAHSKAVRSVNPQWGSAFRRKESSSVPSLCSRCFDDATKPVACGASAFRASRPCWEVRSRKPTHQRR